MYEATLEQSNAPTRLGVLYPGYAGERDYEDYGSILRPPVEVHVSNIPWGHDPDHVAALKDLGSLRRLLENPQEMRDFMPDVVVWACTSASFLWGLDGMIQQAQGMSAAFGVPATSTSLAYIDAIQALNVKRVAIGSIYDEDVAKFFFDILERAGIKIEKVAYVPVEGREEFIRRPDLRQERDPASRFATWTREDFFRIIDDCATSDAEAVLIPETGFRAAGIAHDLERYAQKPVLMANHVTVWSALRLAGKYVPQSHLDSLFALPMTNHLERLIS